MITAEDNAKLGCAIMPWWLNHRDAIERTWVMMHEGDKALRDRAEIAAYHQDACPNVQLQNHHTTVYMVRHRDPGKCEWLTREAYCVRALEILCDNLCRPLTIRTRGGDWRIQAAGQHGQEDIFGRGGSLEEACTDVLAQLDPLWKR